MENVTLSHQDPAKRMQTIREWVGQGSVPESERSGAVALTLLTDLNKLQDRVADIEARQDLEEPPFVSPVPVIGRLIVWMRSAWNWMSTKWYVRPLIQQQTNFNAAAVQAWTDMLAYLESVVRFARAVYGRLDDLEDRLDELAKAQMVAQRPVAMPPVEFADATSLVRWWSFRVAEGRRCAHWQSRGCKSPAQSRMLNWRITGSRVAWTWCTAATLSTWLLYQRVNWAVYWQFGPRRCRRAR
jgi:hypothetical protein